MRRSPFLRKFPPRALLLALAVAWGVGAPTGLMGQRPGPGTHVALITGSTDGLGRELALHLASEGAHVIVHGRNEERAREVVAAIEAQGVGSARYYLADFASLAQVRDLSEAILRDYERLDLLVNNAGVGPGSPGHERVLTEDGHELRFQVNYLAGYLLTMNLLPLFVADGPGGQILNVTSRAQIPLDFDDLRMDRGYSGGQAYGRSKLAQILFTFALGREFGGIGLTMNAVHPAPAMNTGLVRETGSTPQSTVEDGLRALLQVLEAPPDLVGRFFFEGVESEAHPVAYDREVQLRLLAVSQELTGSFRIPPLPESPPPDSR